MMEHEITLDMIDDLIDLEDDLIEQCSNNNDIAVIGLAVKAGSAENVREFWESLCNGEDFAREFPYARAADADAFAQYLGKDPLTYARESYLERIDQFSPSFFHILPKDAALIDPAQRLFMHTAWSALEDAGLSKKRLAGSDTGVFVGYTTESGSYGELISASNPEFGDRGVSGKVNSIIASRLSYHLNLKGPAIMVDTACSSSLVAVHLACNSIRSGECEMAIAGGVKYTLLPEKVEEQGEISVVSMDGQTRTFDVHSDGTNPGEGVGAVILKPLWKAQEDKDHIYAVIKGSAVNQDGASVGITAPNAAAQEAVIVKAWKMAGIDPDNVSYIEAHGTATKLGDPVEISGIERAFRRYTDKKQFCAIGSIKTNLGHLDCAAGIVGLIKCILALEHKKIPPHLNFTSPNREIDFINSPVYINDVLTPWITAGDRICGVSSFGLSGTNCHVVLQEYSETTDSAVCLPMVLPLSAANKTELIKMTKCFVEEATANPEKLACYLYTAAMNKSEYGVRFAVVINELNDLKTLLQRVEEGAMDVQKGDKRDGERLADALVKQIKAGNAEVGAMQKLCKLYTEGVEIDWFDLYRSLPVRIVSMSGYPMKLERCWETPKQSVVREHKTEQGPLIDVCLTESEQLHVYVTMMSEHTNSEVREHIIGDRNVLAGTVYVEMLFYAASKKLRSERLQIDSLVFQAAMIFEKEQIREVQTILYQKNANECEATIQSRPAEGGEWTVHVQAKVSVFEEEQLPPVDLKMLFGRLSENVMDTTETLGDQIVTTGPHWKVQKGIWLGDSEAVTLAAPDEDFAHELERYALYPSMLDAAVNCSSVLNGDVFCLPYFYGSMRIYKRMPRKIYSHTVKNQESSSKDGEIHVFDVVIFDECGEVVATIKDYAMKKISEQQKKQFYTSEECILRTSRWVREPVSHRASTLFRPGESIVVVSKADHYNKKLNHAIRTMAKDGYHEMVLCDWETKNTGRKAYVFPGDRASIVDFFEGMEGKSLSHVVILVPDIEEPDTAETLSAEVETFAHSFFNIIYALASNKALGNIAVDLLIPTKNDSVSPTALMIAGMGKSLLFEYSRLKMRCVLYSPETPEKRVLEELSDNYTDYMVWLRGEERCVQYIEETEPGPIDNFRLTKDGTYLITGGTGGIGLVIAELFAQLEPSVHLILASRSKVLPEDQWQTARDEKYRKLCSIRNKAASVSCVSCNVSDEKAVEMLLNKYPSVNGIVHAAGLPGGGFVLKRKWEDFLRVITPKVCGTWNLVRAARRKNMEFVVLFSSYSTVLAVAGQSDYIGANSFMDAYACYGNDDGLVKVINWSGWKDCGMALENGVDMIKSPVQFLTNAEGAETFRMAMVSKESRVLVGKFNYEELSASMEDYGKVIRFPEETMAKTRGSMNPGKSMSLNIDITVRGKETPLTPTEERIAQAWANTLGLREVDYQDKFLEIGGDSLSATYLQKEIDSIFPNIMDITDVFVYPTIEQMAAFIDSKTMIAEKKNDTKQNDLDQMRMLLEKLASGEIDVSEAGLLI